MSEHWLGGAIAHPPKTAAGGASSVRRALAKVGQPAEEILQEIGAPDEGDLCVGGLEQIDFGVAFREGQRKGARFEVNKVLTVDNYGYVIATYN